MEINWTTARNVLGESHPLDLGESGSGDEGAAVLEPYQEVSCRQMSNFQPAVRWCCLLVCPLLLLLQWEIGAAVRGALGNHRPRYLNPYGGLIDVGDWVQW